MKPIIQAAIESGRPPLELLLDEPNRERTRLDGILIKAYYLQQSYEIEGYPIWVEESPDITFEPKSRVIRSLAVVENAQSKAGGKDGKTTPGKRFWAEAKLRAGAKWPTRRDWLDRKKSGEQVPEDGVDAKRVEAAEARAAARVAQDPEAEAIIAEFQKRFKKGT